MMDSKTVLIGAGVAGLIYSQNGNEIAMYAAVGLGAYWVYTQYQRKQVGPWKGVLNPVGQARAGGMGY